MNDAGMWDYVEIPDENDRAGEKKPGAQCRHAIATPLVVCQRSLFRVSKLIFFSVYATPSNYSFISQQPY